MILSCIVQNFDESRLRSKRHLIPYRIPIGYKARKERIVKRSVSEKGEPKEKNLRISVPQDYHILFCFKLRQML